MSTNKSTENESTKSAAQLILAEKRTSPSVMRTGISVFALPMAVISALIITSKYYETSKVLHLFIPIMMLNFALVVLGSYLVIRSIVRLRHYDPLILDLKRNHPIIAPLS